MKMNLGGSMDTFNQFVNAAVASSNSMYLRWATEEWFSGSWLILAGLLALSWTLLILLIDKSRLREILLFGLALTLLFGAADVIATEYGLWEYKTHMIPLKSSLFPFSYTMPPMFHMLAYQYSSSWGSFAMLATMVNVFFAFVAHPVYVWTDVLWLGNWSYIYSFLYLMSVTLGVRAFVVWLEKAEQQYAAKIRHTFLSPAGQLAMKPLRDQKEKKKE